MTQRVGVIGGGQLAWMMGAEAPSLGLELWVQTPKLSDPAVSRSTQTIYAAVDDARATAELAKHCDVITFENEFVDLSALGELSKQGVRFAPSLEFLAPLLDKYDQRQYCQSLSIPVPQFCQWQLGEPLPEGWHYPVVIKARRHGYDGKGTFVIRTPEALAGLPTELGNVPLMLEEFVPFERELAVMVARNDAGDVKIFPTVETHQIDQVCRWVLAPAEVAQPIIQQIEAIATTLATELKLVGIMGIELFMTPAGDILVNEIAPRTHNSGHFSLDACETSQFAMQLQAIAGLPLGSVAMTTAGAVMVNLLGFESGERDYSPILQSLSDIPRSHVHWYGKKISSPGRKLGHVTVLADSHDRQHLTAIAKQIEALWYGYK